MFSETNILLTKTNGLLQSYFKSSRLQALGFTSTSSSRPERNHSTKYRLSTLKGVIKADNGRLASPKKQIRVFISQTQPQRLCPNQSVPASLGLRLFCTCSRLHHVSSAAHEHALGHGEDQEPTRPRDIDDERAIVQTLPLGKPREKLSDAM